MTANGDASSRFTNIKRVCIIGAGPSGLAAAKYFVAEKYFEKIDVYEQRGRVGGLWNHTPEQYRQTNFNIPNTDPHVPLEKPIWRKKPLQNSGTNGWHGIMTSGQEMVSCEEVEGAVVDDEEGDEFDVKLQEAQFISPIYDRLETNIPRSLMRFSDFPFDDRLQLFPKHDEVLDYIEHYANDVRHLIRFEHQVTDVSLRDNKQWNVRITDFPSGDTKEEVYDVIVAASGHFAVPYVPKIEGIEEWDRTFPGSLSHSKFFRAPEQYADRKVIVVGNSASGLDIGGQIAPLCKAPLLASIKSESYLAPGASDPKVKLELPPISRFELDRRTVHFENGHRETDVGDIIFATGYLYSFPFLDRITPPLITDGTRVQNTYQHLLYAPHPTLALPTLNQKIIPFPVAQAQAAVLARLYSGRLSLPSYVEMRKWEEKRVAAAGSGNKFHEFKFPEDGEYLNMLHDWASQADLRNGLEEEGRGKKPPRWDSKDFWTRERFPAIRKAFVSKGQERDTVRRLEEIGFVPEPNGVGKHANGETQPL